MTKKKELLQVVSICMCTLMLCVPAIEKNRSSDLTEITEEPIALSEYTGKQILVGATDADVMVMPDKYNTGAKGELTKVGISETIQGIVFVSGNNGTVNALDFPKRNPNISGVVTLDNVDFSDYPVWMYREGSIEKNIKVVFNNCNFSQISTGKNPAKISYEFNNCTINHFKGSNAVFNNCSFGKSFKDGIVPYCNVTVNNCFFSDMASQSESGSGLHTDGTQIYGFQDLDVTNVYYNNCRFEIPAIQTTGNTAAINACIMLQLEYSNGKDMKFSNCTINGGGYSLYAREKNKGLTLQNVKFENIKIGCSKLYGSIYPMISPGITFENIGETQYLYAGSVWKDEKGTHVSVTNDTNQERTLVIYADGELYEYVIPACPNGNNLLASYDEYPFDMDMIIPKNCSYIVCYDNTTEGLTKQIRYMNWTNSSVYLDEEIEEKIFGDENAENAIILSGSCGKDMKYELNQAGVLTLSGSGASDNFNSAKKSPWTQYSHLINTVIVGEGIETLGTQMFIECENINTVVLPESIKVISNRAFMKCYCLQNINFPKGLEIIADYAFYGTLIQNASYEGDVEQWETVKVGENNEVIKNVIITTEEVKNSTNESTVSLLSAGECGKDISYKLTKDGVLTLNGKGNTYDYNSVKTAPWYEQRNEIKKLVINEGITGLGTQICNQCKELEEVIIAQSVKKIGGNAFIKCTSLKEIVIPKNITSIQRYAFAGTGLQRTIYKGSTEEWSKIVVGNYNEKLLSNIQYQ